MAQPQCGAACFCKPTESASIRITSKESPTRIWPAGAKVCPSVHSSHKTRGLISAETSPEWYEFRKYWGKRMSNIDKQRIRSVEVLEAHGWHWNGVEWLNPAAKADLTPEADLMHWLLMDRAEELAGATEGSDEEAVLEEIDAVLQAYEEKRWPGGKIPGGKG